MVVIGAGPTGLAAADALQRSGIPSTVLEASATVGGLTSSWTDEHGFTWDHGGHVLFSHYPEVDQLLDDLLGDDATSNERNAAVWMGDRWVPYPFQHNIHRLDPTRYAECLDGIDRRTEQPTDATFDRWILDHFGSGIAEHFMLPYNRKVWSHPLDDLSVSWQGERVPVVDAERIRANAREDRDDADWGPNHRFRFPIGGTGMLCDRLAARLTTPLHLNRAVTGIDARRRVLRVDDGSSIEFDHLLSTMPLDRLVGMIDDCPADVTRAAQRLVHNGGAFVGIGVRGPSPSDRSWMYFPDDEPFYRVTVLSNYSASIHPDGCSSLLAECSFPAGDLPPADLIERTIDGLRGCGLLAPDAEVTSREVRTVSHLYPVPTVGRDDALATIQPWLADHGISSRGRFGAWRYEIGNTDHALMMGLEVATRIATGTPETVWS